MIRPILETAANIRNRVLIKGSCNKAGTTLTPEQKKACGFGNIEAHEPSGDLDAALFREGLLVGERLEFYFFDLYGTTVDEWDDQTPLQKKVRNSRASINGGRHQEHSETRTAVENYLDQLEGMAAEELESPEATSLFSALTVALDNFMQKEKDRARKRTYGGKSKD